MPDELHCEACLDTEIISALGTSMRTIESLRKQLLAENWKLPQTFSILSENTALVACGASHAIGLRPILSRCGLSVC